MKTDFQNWFPFKGNMVLGKIQQELKKILKG